MDVLVIDDDHDLREAICEALADEGYACAQANNGQEALVLLDHVQALPRLILLDLMMPNMNGWEFRAAQLANPLLAPIPVVVMSAYRDKADPVLRANDHISKPLNLDLLLRTVAHYVGI